jgi:hypothetical protein
MSGDVWMIMVLTFPLCYSWEVFTILWQQPGIQALEVQNGDGTWLPAPPVEGTFVVKWVWHQNHAIRHFPVMIHGLTCLVAR